MEMLVDLLNEAIRTQELCIFDHETKIVFNGLAEIHGAGINGYAVQITIDTRQ